MKRRPLLVSSVGLLVDRIGAAQGGRRTFRIGWLTAQRAASLTPYLDALKSSLADLGYAEGRNLQIEFRYGDDDIDKVADLAADLERLPVDVLLAQGAAVPLIAKLKLEVPVVYVFSGDPVSAGLADSLARPRFNMTGLTFMAAELNAKRLELLREVMPGLRQAAIVANPEHPGAHVERAYSEQAAKRLGVTLRYFPTRSRAELAEALTTMAADPPQAISLFADGFAVENRQRIIDFGLGQRAPVISGWPIFARSGALCSYGPRLSDSYRRLAHYADRVLKGARPSELPIERPTTFELVVNLKTARTLGLTVPPSLLVRADEVIS